jgi:CelD/BcsL family acetyltransferase involved in cellulose biosynthesis
MRLLVEAIETEDTLVRLGPEWQRLAATCGDGLPFRTWEWNWRWWASLRGDRFAVKDHLHVRAVRTPAGELVGIAPFMLTHRPRLGPLQVRGLDLFGADPNITELRSVICAPAWEGPVYEAVLSDLGAQEHPWDYVRWRGVRAGSDAHRLLAARADVRVLDATPNFVLDLPHSWEELRSSLSRNMKEALRKCYNSLRREGVAFKLEVLTDAALVPEALDRFFALHRARAEARASTPHEDVFQTEAARTFLTGVCRDLAAREMLRVFALRVGDELVAMRLGFVVADTLYLYFSGYDPRWGHCSVMTTTVAEAVKYAIGAGLKSVNLSNGADASKTRWGPRQVDYLSLEQTSRSLRGVIAHSLLREVERRLNGPATNYARRIVGRAPVRG